MNKPSRCATNQMKERKKANHPTLSNVLNYSRTLTYVSVTYTKLSHLASFGHQPLKIRRNRSFFLSFRLKREQKNQKEKFLRLSPDVDIVDIVDYEAMTAKKKKRFDTLSSPRRETNFHYTTTKETVSASIRSFFNSCNFLHCSASRHWPFQFIKTIKMDLITRARSFLANGRICIFS